MGTLFRTIQSPTVLHGHCLSRLATFNGLSCCLGEFESFAVGMKLLEELSNPAVNTATFGRSDLPQAAVRLPLRYAS